ncbi:MAG: transposon-transfer assisting family protein [Lachnospiraceae bacterium]|nr:transposon-transfer assisting family protein [Lachnospiraceae bacterium]
MDTVFTVEESNLICIFAGEVRNEVIRDIERALPYLEDTDLEELSSRVIGKLQSMTDKEFAQLELTEAE